MSRFDGDLSEIEGNVAFIREAQRVWGRSGEILPLVVAERPVRQLIEEFKRQRPNELDYLYQGLFVQLYASFEWLVRELIGCYVEELCRLHPHYAVLKARKGEPLERNSYHTGIALQQIFENRANIRIDFEDLARNIGSVIPGSTSVVLNATAFKLFLGTLDALSVEKALNRIGIDKSFWDEVGRDPPLQRFFKETGARRVANATKTFLDSFIRRRNNIAHKGDSIEPVSVDDIVNHLAFLRAFARSLVGCAERHCRRA